MPRREEVTVFVLMGEGQRGWVLRLLGAKEVGDLEGIFREGGQPKAEHSGGEGAKAVERHRQLEQRGGVSEGKGVDGEGEDEVQAKENTTKPSGANGSRTYPSPQSFQFNLVH